MINNLNLLLLPHKFQKIFLLKKFWILLKLSLLQNQPSLDLVDELVDVSEKVFVVKQVEFSGEFESLSIHYVISDKFESKVEETPFLGEVEKPMFEKDQPERTWEE